MKLVIDMNMSPEWAAVFLEAGFNATHWSLLGAVDAPDPDIMAFAAAYGYVVFTNDLDFGAILALTRAAGPSVVQVRASELLPEAIGPQVLEGLRDTQSELEQGALVTITPEKNTGQGVAAALRPDLPRLPVRNRHTGIRRAL